MGPRSLRGGFPATRFQSQHPPGRNPSLRGFQSSILLGAKYNAVEISIEITYSTSRREQRLASAEMNFSYISPRARASSALENRLTLLMLPPSFPPFAPVPPFLIKNALYFQYHYSPYSSPPDPRPRKTSFLSPAVGEIMKLKW